MIKKVFLMVVISVVCSLFLSVAAFASLPEHSLPETKKHL